MKVMDDYGKLKNCPKEISDDLLDEDWAQRIHSQTLKRLNERGGLSPLEIYINVNKLPYQTVYNFTETEAVIWLNNYLTNNHKENQ